MCDTSGLTFPLKSRIVWRSVNAWFQVSLYRAERSRGDSNPKVYATSCFLPFFGDQLATYDRRKMRPVPWLVF
jgi:hypothetical protein